MKLRQRPKPIPLQKMEALIPRVSPHLKQFPNMQQDLAFRLKGYIGEKKVDYHVNQLARKYTILHDVYLELPYGHSVQIDSLILTQHAIFIIESKNYSGTITFDTILKQFTRDDGVKETGYKYPITQAGNHQLSLENWLHDHYFPNVPVHFLIAIAEPSTIIKVAGDQQAIAEAVMHGEHIPQKLLEMDAAYARNNNPRIPTRKISDTILRECGEFDTDLMKQYGIKPADVMPGVCCPGCGRLGMVRIHNNWHCNRCKTRSRHAHRLTFAEYFLLIKPWINNSECMRFLQFDGKNIATRLMKDAGLIYDKKHRRWLKGEK